MNRSKKLLAGGGVLAVVGIAVWFSTAREPADDTLAELECSFDAGTAQSYQVNLEVVSRINAGALLPTSGADQMQLEEQKTGMTGVLTMEVIEAGKEDTVLGFAFEPSGTSALAAAATAGELRRPFAAHIDATCRFGDIGFHPDVGPEVRNQLRGLLLSAQVVVPARAAHSWKTLEYDLSGRYGSEYERTDTGPRTLRKTKYGYVDVFQGAASGASSAAADDVSIQVKGGDTVARLSGDNGWLESLASTERLLVSSGRVLVADVRVRMTIESRPEAAAPLEVALAALSWTSHDAPAEHQERAPATPPDEYFTMTLDDALASAMAMLAEDPDAHARVGHMLATLLRAQPELAAELVARVRDGQVPDAMHSAVFFGLEQAGTPEAHAVLVGALSDPGLQPANRMRAAVALPDIAKPTAETLAALELLARVGGNLEDPSREQQLQNAASFAMGTLERNVRESQPELAKQARDSIRQHLTATEDPVEITAALDAIHNSAHPDFVDDLGPYFDSKNDLVRSHAYEAMKQMPPEATEDLFGGLLEHEESDRHRAVLAVTFFEQAASARRPPSPKVWNAAAGRFGKEQNPLVRASYIHLVGAAASSSSDAMGALVKQYGNEKDPRMLKAIGKYVPAHKLP